MPRRILSLIACVAALAITAVLVTGCAASGGPDPAKLEGSWQLESFGGTTELEPADSAVTTVITFQGGQVSGNGGVNSFGGPYKTSGGGGLEIGPVSATEMAGEPPAMEQEARFFEALGKTRHFEFNEGNLILTSSGNDTLVVLAPK